MHLVSDFLLRQGTLIPEKVNEKKLLGSQIYILFLEHCCGVLLELTACDVEFNSYFLR